MDNPTCDIPMCGKPVRTRGLCYAHYMKMWRYGTATPTHDPQWHDVRGNRYGTLTVTDQREGRYWVCRCDCGVTARRTVNQLRVTGSNTTCGQPGAHYPTDAPAYRSAHDRVIRLKGSASTHVCVDCGGGAAHWSYDHTDPSELTTLRDGCLIRYSADPQRYVPRCVPCHKRFDLAHIATTCK